MKFIKLQSIYGGSICFNIENIILIEQYSKSENYAKIYLKNYQYHINTKESPEEIYEMLNKLTN